MLLGWHTLTTIVWHLSPIDLVGKIIKNSQHVLFASLSQFAQRRRSQDRPSILYYSSVLRVLAMSQLVTKQIQVSTVVSCYLSSHYLALVDLNIQL